jgi:hypothetical protein
MQTIFQRNGEFIRSGGLRVGVGINKNRSSDIATGTWHAVMATPNGLTETWCGKRLLAEPEPNQAWESSPLPRCRACEQEMVESSTQR